MPVRIRYDVRIHPLRSQGDNADEQAQSGFWNVVAARTGMMATASRSA
jgi:hypothetical protein